MNEVSVFYKWNSRTRLKMVAAKWAVRLVTWLGCIIVGFLVIPAGILLILISAVRSVTDQIILWINKKAKVI